MAAIFFSPKTGSSIFKSGLQVNTSVQVPFLSELIGTEGFAIVSTVSIQNRDTIQYFLTFDDFISYFYFGKGLGSISIEGVLFSDCDSYFPGASKLNNIIASIRGTEQTVSFGNAVFVGVLSAFNIQALAEENITTFSLQLDVIDHSLTPPVFRSAC